MTLTPDSAMTEAERVAASLTEAGSRYLTDRAKWCAPASWAQKRWMTFPPLNTHRVLQRLGLVDRSGQILDLGLQVRDILRTKESGNAG